MESHCLFTSNHPDQELGPQDLNFVRSCQSRIEPSSPSTKAPFKAACLLLSSHLWIRPLPRSMCGHRGVLRFPLRWHPQHPGQERTWSNGSGQRDCRWTSSIVPQLQSCCAIPSYEGAGKVHKACTGHQRLPHPPLNTLTSFSGTSKASHCGWQQHTVLLPPRMQKEVKKKKPGCKALHLFMIWYLFCNAMYLYSA